ncbi:hypothetical protein [Geobacter sp. SVR]|uniref:hypothetical protein n=1 Tax=Geobacter sp. SVR TaxID=2495594 RepID=UPI00143EF663|nr:hypothetical protein [Geobacter sp. SVR]BCS54711.1 hypothetical protein GSVR_30190 [Geobacter sp. SVR]GCF86481.1 hypothetical protein GSbR_30810 [Geobacter sp. SVR]
MNRYHTSLTTPKINFVLVTILFLVISTVCALQERERRALDKQQKELVRATEGLQRIETAARDYRTALALLRSHYSGEAVKTTPAGQIYSRLDEIQARYRPDNTVFGAIEKNDGNASLTYTLSFTNRDYSTLLDTISQLQRNVFPFTSVDSVTISQKEQQGKGAVVCDISGRITSLEGVKP